MFPYPQRPRVPIASGSLAPSRRIAMSDPARDPHTHAMRENVGRGVHDAAEGAAR